MDVALLWSSARVEGRWSCGGNHVRSQSYTHALIMPKGPSVSDPHHFIPPPFFSFSFWQIRPLLSRLWMFTHCTWFLVAPLSFWLIHWVLSLCNFYRHQTWTWAVQNQNNCKHLCGCAGVLNLKNVGTLQHPFKNEHRIWPMGEQNIKSCVLPWGHFNG